MKKLIDSNENISVVEDKNWKEYWKARMDERLSDAETLKIKDGKIIEIGKNHILIMKLKVSILD